MSNYLYCTILNNRKYLNVAYYDFIYTLPYIVGLDGRFSYQFRKTIQEKETIGNNKNQIHSIEEIHRSANKILCIGFR